MGHVGGYKDIKESVYLTLFLDTQKLRKFQTAVKDVATVDALWICISLLYGISYAVGFMYHILREASALLVQQWWAMRRPLSVGRVTSTDSHAFFYFNMYQPNQESL